MDERFAVIAFLLDIFEMFGGKEVGRDERLFVHACDAVTTGTTGTVGTAEGWCGHWIARAMWS